MVRDENTPDVVHTYVVVESMQILEPLTSEADEVIIRGVRNDEVSAVPVGYHSKVEFGEEGQIICSDLAKWQQEEGNEFMDVNGVDQKFTFE